MPMEGAPQNNIQEDACKTKIMRPEILAITPEILGKNEKLPSLEKIKYVSKIRILTFVTDLFDDWFSTQAKSKNIVFSMKKRILDPAEAEITFELNGNRKDIEEMISETNSYLKTFPKP